MQTKCSANIKINLAKKFDLENWNRQFYGWSTGMLVNFINLLPPPNKWGWCLLSLSTAGAKNPRHSGIPVTLPSHNCRSQKKKWAWIMQIALSPGTLVFQGLWLQGSSIMLISSSAAGSLETLRTPAKARALKICLHCSKRPPCKWGGSESPGSNLSPKVYATILKSHNLSSWADLGSEIWCHKVFNHSVDIPLEFLRYLPKGQEVLWLAAPEQCAMWTSLGLTPRAFRLLGSCPRVADPRGRHGCCRVKLTFHYIFFQDFQFMGNVEKFGMNPNFKTINFTINCWPALFLTHFLKVTRFKLTESLYNSGSSWETYSTVPTTNPEARTEYVFSFHIIINAYHTIQYILITFSRLQTPIKMDSLSKA